jgi:hypothetical protein
VAAAAAVVMAAAAAAVVAATAAVVVGVVEEVAMMTMKLAVKMIVTMTVKGRMTVKMVDWVIRGESKDCLFSLGLKNW